MDRGASPVLTARGAGAGGIDADGPRDAARARHGRLRRALVGLGDSCALAAVALLGCLALIALGTVCSLLWMLVSEL